jgi:hypothetical protein
MIGQQLSIPQLKLHLSTSHVAIGMAGELLIARALEERGYQVAITHQHGDLTAYTPQGEILYIEVKTARRCKDGKWRFTLYKQGHTDHKRADLVALVCVLRTGDVTPFIVPVSALIDKHQACITSYPTDYRGWLVQYRQILRSLTLECVQ